MAIIILIIGSFCRIKKCSKCARKKMRGMAFNSLLKVIDGTFLLILMTAAINIKKVRDGQIEANSCFYLSIFGLIVCFGELTCISIYLKVY